MWKKIFFGGAKSFANDASRIVGKEMTRRAKEKKNEEYERLIAGLEHEEVLEAKERAVYLNELKRTIFEQSQSQGRLLEIFKDIVEQISESIDIVTTFDDEEDIIDALEDERGNIRSRESMYEFLLKESDDYSERYDDYTIQHFCKRGRQSDESILLLIEDIEEVLEGSRDPEFLDGKLSGVIDAFVLIADVNMEQMKNDHQDITSANMPTGRLNGKSHQFDYNDYSDPVFYDDDEF